MARALLFLEKEIQTTIKLTTPNQLIQLILSLATFKLRTAMQRNKRAQTKIFEKPFLNCSMFKILKSFDYFRLTSTSFIQYLRR